MGHARFGAFDQEIDNVVTQFVIAIKVMQLGAGA